MLIRFLWTLSIVFPLALSSAVNASGEWTEWIVDNFNGDVSKPIPDSSVHIAEFQVREQIGYGLVNLRIRYEINQRKLRWSGWATQNMEGSRRTVSIPLGARVVGIAVREEAGHGLINGRLLYRIGNQSEWTPWVTGNHRGHVAQQFCQRGSYGKGIQVREEAGYGIVNLRMYCQW